MDGNRTIDPSCRDRPPVAIDIISRELNRSNRPMFSIDVFFILA
jgi:hypothetical protein